MRSNGNLKWGQWSKLFTKHKSRIMQSLNIFEHQDDNCINLESLEGFEIIGKSLKPGQAH
jgi:hypothetical protein